MSPTISETAEARVSLAFSVLLAEAALTASS
jgi:hypothetical protein